VSITTFIIADWANPLRTHIYAALALILLTCGGMYCCGIGRLKGYIHTHN